MKFKVGDRVRIKENLKAKEYQEHNNISVTSYMEKFAGKIMTISEIEANKYYAKDVYRMKEDNQGWNWYDFMIEGKVEFTKSDLKDGDIVTYRNGQQRTIIGEKLINKNGDITSEMDYYKEDLTKIFTQKEYEIVKVERPTQYETVFERKEEILDEAEKRYLSNVIRPFRDRVDNIYKYGAENTKSFIKIILDNNKDSIALPYFEPNTMYKGMEMDKKYTLEELRTIAYEIRIYRTNKR